MREADRAEPPDHISAPSQAAAAAHDDDGQAPPNGRAKINKIITL